MLDTLFTKYDRLMLFDTDTLAPVALVVGIILLMFVKILLNRKKILLRQIFLTFLNSF